MPDLHHCIFCRSETGEWIPVSDDGVSCESCARRLGMLLKLADPALFTIWPVLVEDEEEIGGEPVVRLEDGRKVELRHRTAELKRELTTEQRAELAGTYIDIGLLREAVLEAGEVLSRGELPASQRVMRLLFQPPLAAPDAAERVRPFLLPI